MSQTEHEQIDRLVSPSSSDMQINLVSPLSNMLARAGGGGLYTQVAEDDLRKA